jgi:hypothetical protein
MAQFTRQKSSYEAEMIGLFERIEDDRAIWRIETELQIELIWKYGSTMKWLMTKDLCHAEAGKSTEYQSAVLSNSDVKTVECVDYPTPWEILHNLLLQTSTKSSFTSESISLVQGNHHLLYNTRLPPILENTFCLITSRPITRASEGRSWYLICEHINLKWPDSHVRMVMTETITSTLFERIEANAGWSPEIAGSHGSKQTRR